MNTFTIDTRDDIPASYYMQQAIAIELALGCSLPEMVRDWPMGLAISWNAAADAGTFDACKTLGDMARAFLGFRIEKLNN